MKKRWIKRTAACGMTVLVFLLWGMTTYADPISSGNYGTGDDNDTEWNDDWNTSSGQCGDNMEWVLDHSNGALSISGEGEMWCRTSHGEDLWNVRNVSSVAFSGDITSIGAEAFSGCTQLTAVALPRTVKRVGTGAFEGCAALGRVELVNTVATLGNQCFAGCEALTDLYFTGSAQDWRFLTEGIQTGLSPSVVMHFSSSVTVTVQPSDVRVSPGALARFSVVAQGNGALQYQWYYRKKGATGWSIWKKHATAATSAVANDSWNGMQVYCRIEDSDHYVSSDLCTITLLEGVKIITQPSDVTMNVGEEATFTVKAEGNDLNYQWYYKKAGAAAWSIWKAHTTATTVARANDTWDGMQVYCRVSDSAGASTNSQPATVKLNGMPKIVTQSGDVATGVDAIVRFSVKAQGSHLTYQWYYMKYGAKCWSVWKKHTTATTTACSNSTWDGMQVYCRITDGFGRTLSSEPVTIRLTKS